MNEKNQLKEILDVLPLRPAEKIYLRRLLRKVAHYFKPENRVLDVGCGDGKPSEVLAALGCHVMGIDVEAHPERWEMLRNKGIICQEGNAEKLSFADASFDAVWIKDAFHHMENPAVALRELQRVVKPGGPIVVVEANRYNPVFYIHLTLLGDHQHYTRRALKRFLRKADENFVYMQGESRCLPWDAKWILMLLELFEETLERVKIFNPWLTYQFGVVKGKGQ
ncbi:class I SAM-dependent methyltransferase [bacterium]|nr:class I SAM-dependent methyltransferase [bacterium]